MGEERHIEGMHDAEDPLDFTGEFDAGVPVNLKAGDGGALERLETDVKENGNVFVTEVAPDRREVPLGAAPAGDLTQG